MTDNILAVNGRAPSIASDAWVAPTANVIGSNHWPGTGIFYKAVVRADVEDIVIGATAIFRTPPSFTQTRDILPESATMPVSGMGPCSTATPWMTEHLWA